MPVREWWFAAGGAWQQAASPNAAVSQHNILNSGGSNILVKRMGGRLYRQRLHRYWIPNPHPALEWHGLDVYDQPVTRARWPKRAVGKQPHAAERLLAAPRSVPASAVCLVH